MSQAKDYSVTLDLERVEPALKREGQTVSSSGGSAKGRGTLRTDSRKITPGDIFLAYKGVTSDGHAHLSAAADKGAALFVLEDPRHIPTGCSVPWVAVRSGRAAWAYLAAEGTGQPQEGLKLVGVTGTNGKTSTVWMIGQLLAAVGMPCLTIGTLGAYLGKTHVPTGHTTPDPDLLYGLMAEAKALGIGIAAMEVSSHAIAQEKVLPLRYEACAFTSFTRDHLDFHPTMDDYFATKERLFTKLSRPGARMAFWQGLDREVDPSCLSDDAYVYGRSPKAVAAQRHAKPAAIDVEAMDFSGTTLSLTVDDQKLSGKIPYFASHALENFTAAFLMASRVAGRFIPAAHWSQLAPVPGRLEQVTGRLKVPVVVDYAHTPDALEKTLQVLRPFCKGRLVVVFGCGGDRDRGKRPLMGQIAEAHADRIYITSDNPRSEDPEAILREIRAGLKKPDAATLEVDRAQAIRRAIIDAGLDDLVLIAGKGHETYQVLRTGTVAFDDRAVARDVLNADARKTLDGKG